MPSALHTLWVKIGANTDELKRKLKTVTKSFSGMGQQLQMAGIRASIMFTAPITIAARKAFKEISQFEQNMARSTAIMGDLSDAMMEKLAGTAKEVARELPRSAKEMAEGFFFLASAGLDATQSIAALPAVANFAVAGAFDLARATSLAADAQSALGLKSEDAQENLENLVRVTDVLVKANTLANATTEQFSRSLTTKAGAAIKIVNKSMEEGVAVLAAFADQGIKAENAGTALNIVFRDLKTKGLKNRVEWEKLGGVYDKTTGKMRHMADIIESLEVHLKGASDETAQARLKMLGFSDKSLVFTQALIGMSDKIRQFESDLILAGGTTEEVAEKQLKNLADQMTIATQKMEDATRELGGALRPAFEALIGVIESLAAALASASQWFASLGPIMYGIIVFCGLLLFAIGPLLIALAMLAFAIHGVKFAVEKLSMSFRKLLLISGGIGIALAVLGAAWMGFSKKTDKATESMEKANEIFRLAKKAFKDAKEELELFKDAAVLGPALENSLQRARKEMRELEAEVSKIFKTFEKVSASAGVGGVSLDKAAIERNKEKLRQIEKIKQALAVWQAREKDLTEQLKEANKALFDNATMTKIAALEAQHMEAAISLSSFEMARAGAAAKGAGADIVEAFYASKTSTDEFAAAMLKLDERHLIVVTNAMKRLEKTGVTSGSVFDELKGTIDRLGGSIARYLAMLPSAHQFKELAAFDSTAWTEAKNEIHALGTEFSIFDSAMRKATGFKDLTDDFTKAAAEARVVEDAISTLVEEAVAAGIKGVDAWKEFFKRDDIIKMREELVRLYGVMADEEPLHKAKENWNAWLESTQEVITAFTDAWTDAADSFASGMGDAVGDAIVSGEDFGRAMKVVFNNMLADFISAIVEMIIRWAIGSLLMAATTSATTNSKISGSAAEAGAAAYAAYAGIPVIGPALGAAAAAVAIAGTMAAATAGKAAGIGFFAEGGIVTRPTLGIIGEAGPEAVIPLSRAGSFGGLSGGTQTINLYLDGELVTGTVLRNMPEQVRLNLGSAI